jgi:hypothetical protein
MKASARNGATVGIVEHGNDAIAVTIGPGDEILDRRSIALTQGLPTHPYHHEGAWAVGRYLDSPWARPISFSDAVALVARVTEAAAHGAQKGLTALAADIAFPITAIAIRICPALPPSIEERIHDNRAQVVADSVMYREAMANAAHAQGWSVEWYDRDRIYEEAASRLGITDVDPLLRDMGRRIGPPWHAKHKLATVAALVAARRQSTRAAP